MGRQWTQCQTLFLGGSKISADGDCSHEIKRCLLFGRRAMTIPGIIKKKEKSDITLPSKAHIVKAMVFPLAMYGCENWTLKKAECQRIDVFELWCWRRLLRVPWTALRRKSRVNIHCKDWCWSWSSNTLATWWDEPTYWKRLWCWESLMTKGEGGSRWWDG